jgi:hypothetical protein
VQDLTVVFKGFVEVVLIVHTKCNNELYIVVPLAKLKVAFVDNGFVWGDKDFYGVFDYLVAKVVSFFFIEGNDEVTQAISGVVKGFFRLKKSYSWWRFTTKNSRGVLLLLIKKLC